MKNIIFRKYPQQLGGKPFSLSGCRKHKLCWTGPVAQSSQHSANLSLCQRDTRLNTAWIRQEMRI